MIDCATTLHSIRKHKKREEKDRGGGGCLRNKEGVRMGERKEGRKYRSRFGHIVGDIRTGKLTKKKNFRKKSSRHEKGTGKENRFGYTSI